MRRRIHGHGKVHAYASYRCASTGSSQLSWVNKSITKELRDLSSAADILEVCEKRLPEFNLINAVTALHRMAKAHDSRAVIHSRMENLLRRVASDPGCAPQDLTNVALQCAHLRITEADLLGKVCAASASKIAQFDSQQIAKTSWAFAKIRYDNSSFMSAISSATIARTPEWSPRHLGNTAWAFATLGGYSDPLLEAIANTAVSRSSELNPQSITNMSWAFATCKWYDEELMDALAERSYDVIGEFKPMEISNTLWACATLKYTNRKLLRLFSSAAQSRVDTFIPQDYSNTTWAFATLMVVDEQFFTSVVFSSMGKLEHFTPQHLCNTVWSFATARFANERWLDAVSHSVIRAVPELRPDALASTVWSFARLSSCNAQLFESVANRALRMILPRSSRGRMPERNIGMMLWAYCQVGDVTSAQQLLRVACKSELRLDGLSFSGMFMAYQQQRRRADCAQLLIDSFQRGAIVPAAATASAALFAEHGDTERALEILRRAGEAGDIHIGSKQVWIACGGDPQKLPTPPQVPQALPKEPYAKEMGVLSHVLNIATAGDVQSVCAAIESYGIDTLPNTSLWLKVAAGPKSSILVNAVQNSPVGGVCVEVGTYCGYSSALFAKTRAEDARANVGPCQSHPTVVTLEVDLAHAVIAQNVLMFAGVWHLVDILVGHSEETLPWLARKLKTLPGVDGDPCVDLVFMDQRGSRYVADLAALEREHLLKKRARIIADNVLKPGAPLFLWHMSRGRRFKTRVWTMDEFAMENVEDWVTESEYNPEPGAPIFGKLHVPEEILILEDMAERMREKTHQPDKGGSGVGFEEWAAFSDRMRAGMQAAGLATNPLPRT